MPQVSPSTQPIAVVGRYALYGEVASGGMATVYYGCTIDQDGPGRVVAVKRMHPHFARDPEFTSMFIDEANLAARVRHPNVVQVLDIVAADGELSIVMEYVQGDTLARVQRACQKTGQAPPVAVLASLMVGVLEGLHAAHEAVDDGGGALGIVHRDVSPDNILVGRDGMARVFDFGVAKAAGRLQVTRQGQLKGRLHYMPPEQIRNKGVDRRTDVYAASAVLWEALAGRRLFEADNEGAVMCMILEGLVPSLRHLRSDVPAALEDVVLKGLRIDQQDRYQTARAMARAIHAAMVLATQEEVAAWVASVLADEPDRRVARVQAATAVATGAFPAIVPGRDLPMGQPRTEEPSKPRKLWSAAVLGTILLCVVGFWFALHEIPWLGPTLIDTSRAVLGHGITAWIERLAHDVDSGWNGLWGIEERPEAYWNLPSASASGSASPPPVRRFHLDRLQPMQPAPFARNDGAWITALDEGPGAIPHALRAVLHPDADRPDSVAYVVAFDLRRTRVVLAEGDVPPPEAQVGVLVVVRARAAKAGVGLGLRARGATLAPPKAGACTLLQDAKHPLRIGIWETLSTAPDDAVWLRQVPRCLVESGYASTGLEPPSGERGNAPKVDVRRVALGVGGGGQVGYVALGSSVAESTMAAVMVHAGAREAAQLGDASAAANLVLHDAADEVDASGQKLLMPGESGSDDGVLNFFYLVRADGP